MYANVKCLTIVCVCVCARACVHNMIVGGQSMLHVVHKS